MFLYLISYDIAEAAIATTVRHKLEELDAKSILESEWLLESESTAKAVFLNLAEGLDRDRDRLMIVRLCRDAVYTKDTLLTNHDIVNAMFKRSAVKC